MERRDEVAHLLRRTAFLGSPAELDRAEQEGYEATVERIVGGLTAATPKADAVPLPTLTSGLDVGDAKDLATRKAIRQQASDLVAWWLGRMAVSEQPAQERLVWFWHGHVATSIQKVKLAGLMHTQQDVFRGLGSGPFADLMVAVARDPAMLIWLDAGQNRKGSPNENFARELLELFTMGIGSYTETDVKEAARALTGWAVDRTAGTFVARPRQHDDGQKTVLGTTGALTGEDVVRLAATSDAATRFVASRLWSRYAAPVRPDDPIAADLAAAWKGDGRTDTLLRAVLLHPRFRDPALRDGLVREPVLWLATALRALGVTPAALTAKGGDRLSEACTGLGQLPFAPPSVGGWPAQGAWLSTAAAATRLQVARTVAGTADLSWLGTLAPAGRPAALAARLGRSAWSTGTTAALAKVAGDPVGITTLALVAPETLVS